MAPPQWAYQVEHFVSEPDEELVCSICRAVFCDPVMCPCDHVFCRVCISKWLQNNRNCPICRKRVSHSSIKQTVPIIKNLIMKLLLNCHNKSLGCKAQFSVESSEGHMKECEYEFVQCKNKPCKDKLFRKDITEHETSDCPHRYVKCKVCGSKMPTSAVPDKHVCIRALQLRLRRKNNIIRRKNNRITALRNENRVLKAASQGSGRLLTSSTSRSFVPLTSSTLSSLSPEEIMINIAEMDSMSSSSITSDSDDSSENNILIFANSPLDHSDDNAGSESFSAYIDNQDSVEYSLNESPRDISEYRNAESQTTDGNLLNDRQSDSNHGRNSNSAYENGVEVHSHHGRNGNSANENDSITVEVPDSVFGEIEERSQPRRPVKRRPTSQKPAKRRLPPFSPSSSDDNESRQPSSRSSKRCWRLRGSEEDQEDTCNTYMEAGPSCVSMPVEDSSAAAAAIDTSSNPKWHFRSKAKLDLKQATMNASDNSLGSRVAVPSGNAVFERTLALLEQYNLESDPEWLPEYASHRGNDTTTDSDSSYDLIESSSSELSDSNNENNSNAIRDNSEHDPPAISDFMHWMFDSTSDDDPDWHPALNYNYFED